jgi:hypothetical protein
MEFLGAADRQAVFEANARAVFPRLKPTLQG